MRKKVKKILKTKRFYKHDGLYLCLSFDSFYARPEGKRINVIEPLIGIADNAEKAEEKMKIDLLTYLQRPTQEAFYELSPKFLTPTMEAKWQKKLDRIRKIIFEN